MTRGRRTTRFLPGVAAGLLATVTPAFSNSSAAEENPIFSERGVELGIDFTHFTGATGELLFPEIVGAGVGVLDYDNDGDLDLFLVQGARLPTPEELGEPLRPSQGAKRGRLFRNDLDTPPGSTLRFTDVTDSAEIQSLGYGMGVAVGDYDRDGWVDLYVTNFGRNELWHNNGAGPDGRVTFSEVGRSTGVDDPGWSVSAAFFDYDRDGWTDLYVGNYTNFRTAANKRCRAPAGYRDYCSPTSYDPQPDGLYRNLGDGTFQNVTQQAGLRAEFGNGLGAVVGDFNSNGWLDLYVANDEMPNQLWINQGNGRFEDLALINGCAVSGMGEPEASMGIDAADFDADGDLDLFMTHYAHESNTLYVNDGSGGFEDQSLATGLGTPSWQYTGFGTAFLDYDNDGWLDLLTVNGAAIFIPALLHADDPHPLHERNQLFRNLGNRRFEDVTAAAGPAFELSEVSRGAAFGDLDNDGDPDVVISNNRGPARILINRVGQDAVWMGLRMVDGTGRRDPIGTKVAVLRQGKPTLWRHVRTAASFASASDPRLVIGLGDDTDLERLLVHWPSGRVEQWNDIELRTYTELREGSGTTLTEPSPSPSLSP